MKALFALISLLSCLTFEVGAHGDLHERIAALTKAIAEKPADATLRLRRAELHREHKDWQSAHADLAQARRLDPALAAVDLAEALVHFEAGTIDLALPSIDRFISAQPERAEGHLVRARILDALGRSAAAVDSWTRGLEQSAKPQPEHFLARAASQLACRPPRYDEAIGGLEAARAKLGKAVVIRARLIEVLEAAGRVDDALREAALMVAEAKRPEVHLLVRADILLRAGRKSEAAREYRAVLDAVGRLDERRRSQASSRNAAERARAALASIEGGKS